jgi:hypothetical protein
MANESLSKTNPQQQQQSHLFISYQLHDEEIVNNFVQQLRKQLNLEIWFDKEKIKKINKNITQQINEGIEQSELFICFISRLYSQSKNCIDEISYAKTLKKRVIVIMLESANTEELADVGVIINGRLRINAYKEISLFKDAQGDEFKKLIKSLTNALDVSCLKVESDKKVKKTAVKQIKQELNDNFTFLMKGI